MGKKKKIRKIVEAVGHLFATPPDRKRLKKAKAFERFLSELRERRDALEVQADAAAPGAGEELRQDLEVLDRQIAKAERLLATLEGE